jgi:two-component system, OmpR family, copper resistance phosphate regulon response regulator CusR
MRILVIEDDLKTGAYLRKGLSENGFNVKVATEGEEGLYLALTREFDLILLDVMLPDIDGWQVLKKLRFRENKTPVIFLTARDSVPDRVKGLELGANDYLVKPFAFSELIARIKNALRHGPTKHEELFRVGDLELDPISHTAKRAGKRLDLTPKEFALLSLLIRRTGEVLTRVRISERIWNMEFESDTNVVDVHMRRLRAKVDDPFERKLIHTVRGVGYVLEEREP